MKLFSVLSKNIMLLMLGVSGSLAFAQEEDRLKSFHFSGSADIFYKYDFANVDFNTRTSFTIPNNSFELGMLSLKMTHKTGKFGLTADVGVGNRVEQFNYTQSNTGLIIKQLFIDYAATDKLTITAGSWTTHIGYELLDAPDNDIYSMSYVFSYGPFFHTGLKANYVLDKFNFMAGIANPTDLRSSFQKVEVVEVSGDVMTESYRNKFFIWQIGYAADSFNVYLNGQQGSYNPQSSNISQFDITAACKVTDKLKLGLNATTFESKDDLDDFKKRWSSIVGYLKYGLTEHLALNYRAELLNNKENALAIGSGTVGQNIFANTISGTLSYGNFQLKPEIRFEKATEPIFIKKKEVATESAGNFLIAAMYKF